MRWESRDTRGPARACLVVVDGLRHDAARREAGWLEGMVEAGRAAKFEVQAALPSVSRPCYATLLTGSAVADHGVVSNRMTRAPEGRTLFEVVRSSGGRTAASAYHFFYELAYGAPYHPVRCCEWYDEDGPITWGRFYQDETMPDREVAWRAEALATGYEPDFLLVHLNGLDVVGHRHGGEAKEYYAHVQVVDSIIAELSLALLPRYELYVTGDHGTSAVGLHGGTEACVRATCLYAVPGWPGAVQGEAGPLRQEDVGSTLKSHLTSRVLA